MIGCHQPDPLTCKVTASWFAWILRYTMQVIDVLPLCFYDGSASACGPGLDTRAAGHLMAGSLRKPPGPAPTRMASPGAAQGSRNAGGSSVWWSSLPDSHFQLLPGCNEYHLFGQGFLGMLELLQ
jgi:hypothetical protein